MNTQLRQPRSDLPPIPERMRLLPIDARGYPVPWFVDWINGVPDFRVMDRRKWWLSIRFGDCWLCGEPVGKWKTFVIGPMCAVNRTTSEPGCHYACAEFAAMACPFMTLPRAQRRNANLPPHQHQGGMPIDRNPGATCLWTTQFFELFDGLLEAGPVPGANPGQLLRLGDPKTVQWYAEGRLATREEVWASIESGLPLLEDLARQQDEIQRRGHECRDELAKQVAAFQQFLPPAAA
jgi:hypothetical protein